MGQDFVVSFDEKKWHNLISRLQKNIDAKKLADVASPMVFSDVQEHFAKEEGPEGHWEGWSFSYFDKLINSKKKRFASHAASGKILQFSGKLRNNFLPTKKRVEKYKITWFNNAKTKKGFPYAYAHDTGGPKLPQRSFMWLSNSAFDKIVNSYMKYVEEE